MEQDGRCRFDFLAEKHTNRKTSSKKKFKIATVYSFNLQWQFLTGHKKSCYKTCVPVSLSVCVLLIHFMYKAVFLQGEYQLFYVKSSQKMLSSIFL